MDNYKLEIWFSLINIWESQYGPGTDGLWRGNGVGDDVVINTLKVIDIDSQETAFQLQPLSYIRDTDGTAFRRVTSNEYRYGVPWNTYDVSWRNVLYRTAQSPTTPELKLGLCGCSPTFTWGNRFLLKGPTEILWEGVSGQSGCYKLRNAVFSGDDEYTSNEYLYHMDLYSHRYLDSCVWQTVLPRWPRVYLQYPYTKQNVIDGNVDPDYFAYGYFSGQFTGDGFEIDVVAFDEPARRICTDPVGDAEGPYPYEPTNTTTWHITCNDPMTCSVVADSYIRIFKNDDIKPPYSSTGKTFVLDDTGTIISNPEEAFFWTLKRKYASSYGPYAEGEIVYNKYNQKYYRSLVDGNGYDDRYANILPGNEDYDYWKEHESLASNYIFPTDENTSNEWWEEVGEEELIANSTQYAEAIRSGTLIFNNEPTSSVYSLELGLELQHAWGYPSGWLTQRILDDIGITSFRLMDDTNDTVIMQLEWNWSNMEPVEGTSYKRYTDGILYFHESVVDEHSGSGTVIYDTQTYDAILTADEYSNLPEQLKSSYHPVYRLGGSDTIDVGDVQPLFLRPFMYPVYYNREELNSTVPDSFCFYDAATDTATIWNRAETGNETVFSINKNTLADGAFYKLSAWDSDYLDRIYRVYLTYQYIDDTTPNGYSIYPITFGYFSLTFTGDDVSVDVVKYNRPVIGDDASMSQSTSFHFSAPYNDGYDTTNPYHLSVDSQAHVGFNGTLGLFVYDDEGNILSPKNYLWQAQTSYTAGSLVSVYDETNNHYVFYRNDSNINKKAVFSVADGWTEVTESELMTGTSEEKAYLNRGTLTIGGSAATVTPADPDSGDDPGGDPTPEPDPDPAGTIAFTWDAYTHRI